MATHRNVLLIPATLSRWKCIIILLYLRHCAGGNVLLYYYTCDTVHVEMYYYIIIPATLCMWKCIIILLYLRH